MANFDANHARAVAIELQARIADVFLAVLPIQTAAAEWVLNGTDPMLPPPYDIGIALAGYQALEVESLKLDAWVTELLTAQYGDGLTYPPPPISLSTGLADGSGVADGTVLADGNG